MTTARRPIIALLVVLSFSGLYTLWSQGRSGAGIDFYQMWVGTRLARETRDFYAPATGARGGEEYLRRAAFEEHSPRRLAVAQHRRQLELVSTPFLYMLYAPLRGTYERDLFLFQSLTILAFVAAVALLARTFGYGVPLGLAFLAVLVNAFVPVATDIRVANSNSIVLLIVAAAAAMTAKRSFLASGALLALATLVKPYVVVILLLTYAIWVLKRRWRDLAAHLSGAAIIAVAGIVASSFYFRSARIWIEWVQALRALPRAMVPLEIGNFALARIVEDLWGVHLSTFLLVIAFAVAVFVAWRAQSAPTHTDLLTIGLGCVIALLGSPLVWVHYLVLCIPLLAYLLRPAADDEPPAQARRRQIAAAIALSMLAIEPWAQLIPTTIQLAAFVNLGFLITFVAGLDDLRAPRIA